MLRELFQVDETAITIIAEEQEYSEVAKRAILRARAELEKFIFQAKLFAITLEPYHCNEEAPEIVKRMCEESSKFGIGPMSAVAGAIAQVALEAMLEKGAEHAIVDNGGDIAMALKKPANVGIYAGESKIKNLALKIMPEMTPLGICTSSATIGHSISFGKADASVVVANNAILADSAATALGNAVRSEEEIEKSFEVVKNIDGIIGALVIVNDKLGLWGELPEIIKADAKFEVITKGRKFKFPTRQEF
ncbi:MAG: UPF0280 family protein [Candidatus Thermoplasmatota archaeon]|nr:UPF0280 family protein [Candidatus Thermoplasmatota archaeon]